MAYDKTNKRLYVGNGKGISLSEIAECLGDFRVDSRGGRNLGMLCTSPNINVWSKNKPFPADNDHPTGVQSAEDRKASVYGYYWQGQIDDYECPVAKSATDCFNRGISSEGKWLLRDPDIYRVRDFDGYHHDAKAPYNAECITGNLSCNKVLKVSSDLTDTGIEFRMSDMPRLTAPYNVDIEDLELVLLCRNRNDYDLQVVRTGMNVYHLDREYGEQEASLKVKPTTEDDPQVYDAIWAAYNGKTTSNNPVWIYLPNSATEFLMTGYYKMSYDWNSATFEAINTNNYVVTDKTQSVKRFSLWIDNFYNLDYLPEGKVILKVWFKDAGFDNAAEYEYPLHIDGVQEFLQIPAMNARADSTMVAMDVYVRDSSIPVTTSPDYATYHFNFLSGKLELGVAESADGVSAWDIIQYVNNNRP